MTKASVQKIGKLLVPEEPASDGRSWVQALQAGWMKRDCGEVRGEPDVGWIPRDELIEIAYTKDAKGPVLRWMRQSEATQVRALGFSALSYTGNEIAPTSHGWIIVKSDGTLVVQDPAKVQEELRPPLAVSQYGYQLGSAFNNGGGSNFAWSEALRLGAARQVCGEIRTAADLDRMPKNLKLRAVYVNDGGEGHIRWADSAKMTQVFQAANHDYLHCAGDMYVPEREGYLMVTDDNQIQVLA